MDFRPTAAFVLVAAAWAVPSVAQSLGTFRWQLQPYCNVVTVTVVQDGGQYQLDGTDDQCGATRKASVVGLAFPNPDGTIGLGLTIVTTPGGAPVHLDARISIATLSGPWNDSAGATGTFAFTPGASSGGTPRPQASSIPATIRLLTDGGLVAGGAPDVGTIPATGAGVRMMWYPGKASFRAGSVGGVQWNDANIGPYSVAFGRDTIASGAFAVAMGDRTAASGLNAVSMGFATQALGFASTALGFGSRTLGGASTAMGDNTTAIGEASIALGRNTTANGHFSVAMGHGSTTTGVYGFAGGSNSSAGDIAFAFGQDASALGAGSVALGLTARTTAAGSGSFMFADRSTFAPFQSNAANEFGARFAGGYYFYTSSDLSTGAVIGPGGGDWTALSDANAKENFRDVDGEVLLAQLARVPIREWNYKAQSADIRHIGPTAQDFRAAFGLGDFPLRINTIDASGVALGGVRALDARTRVLLERAATLEAENATRRAEVDALRERHDALARDNAGLRERLERLEGLLAPR